MARSSRSARVAADGALSDTVVHVERLGGDTNLVVALDSGETLTVRQFGQHPRAVRESVALAFDPGRVLRFDEAGRRLR